MTPERIQRLYAVFGGVLKCDPAGQAALLEDPRRGAGRYPRRHPQPGRDPSLDATPLNLVRPKVPVELAALVAKMMAKEPGSRS